MKKAVWFSIIGVIADVVSLAIFASFLRSGPVSGLVEPWLANWWLGLLLLIRFGFFVLLGVLVGRQFDQIHPLSQKLVERLTFSGSYWKKILLLLVWTGLLSLGFFQLILDLVYIFLNYNVTSNNVSNVAQVIILGLVILSCLAFSAVFALSFSRKNYLARLATPENLKKHKALYLIMYALSAIVFPFFTVLLVLRFLRQTQPPEQSVRGEKKEPIQLFVIAQTFLSILILNFLHVEVAVQASSELHPFIYYIQRVGMIFLLWYIPYKGMLWIVNANRTKFELAWGVVYGLLQVALVYLLV